MIEPITALVRYDATTGKNMQIEKFTGFSLCYKCFGYNYCTYQKIV
jgi:hypothetical protein